MLTLNLPAAWLAFLRRLNAHGVEYVVIGGCALACHGYRRPIGDLDVFVGTNAETAARLVAVLAEHGHGVAPEVEALLQLPERVIRVGAPPYRVEHFAPADRFIHLGRQPAEIEIMTTISGTTFAECYPNRLAAVLDGVPVPVIGRAQLLANKAASIRPKDADDLAQLKRV